MYRLLLGSLCVAAVATLSFQSPPTLPLSQIKLPPGFTIDLYATGVPHAREMVPGSKGTLFVGSRDDKKVYAIVDKK